VPVSNYYCQCQSSRVEDKKKCVIVLPRDLSVNNRGFIYFVASFCPLFRFVS